MAATGESAQLVRSAGWALGAAVAAAHLVGEARGLPGLALYVKPVPVLLLAVALARSPSSRARGPLLAGLLASAAGDFLIQRPGGFLQGLTAFLVAHLFYVAGFWRLRREPLWPRGLPVAAFGAAMTALLLSGLAAAGPAIRGAVLAYILAICVMLWRAAALPGAPGLDPVVGRLALGGAILFAASDSLIAVHRFVAPQAWTDVPIMLLYWAGQCGIALAGIRAARKV
jgi:uncharacterized membrane protein YhhN